MLTDLKKQASILPSAHEAKNDTPMKASGPDAPNRKPSVFIGSSSEGLQVARCLQMEMDYEAEVTIWHQGVFGLSGGTLESLVRKVSDIRTHHSIESFQNSCAKVVTSPTKMELEENLFTETNSMMKIS